jgi:O-antigen ligase
MLGLLFTYALCYGGSVVSLFYPFVGLLIYVCFAMLKPDALWFWSVPPANYSRIIAISLLIGWGMRGFGNWQLANARGITIAFCTLWLWSILSALQAPDQGRAWYFVESIFKILVPFLVGLSLIDSVKKLKQLIWVMVLSQSYVALYFNQYYLQGYNLLKENGFAGAEEGTVSIGMVSALGLAIYLILESDTWWQKAVAFFASGCLVHTVLISFSRGGMLGLITIGAATLLMVPKSPKNLAVLAVGGLIALSLAGKEVMQRFETSFADQSQRDYSAQNRLDLWGHCLDAMIRNPVLGLGPWQFPLAARDYYGVGRAAEGHSLWLQMGAELGVPGFVSLILFYGLGIGRLWPLTRESTTISDPWLRHGARMVVISTIGFAVAAQFISVWSIEFPYYTMLIGAAVLKLHSILGADVCAVEAYATSLEVERTFYLDHETVRSR